MTLPSSGQITLLMIKSEFNGSNSFGDYYRGGPYVPNTPANANISTSASGLSMTQFYGASAYTAVTGTPSTSTLSSSASSKGSFTIGTVTITGHNGTGSYSYSTASLISGVSSGDNSNISFTQSGNAYTFKATNLNINTDHLSGTWQVTVSDGQTSANVTFVVNWN